MHGSIEYSYGEKNASCSAVYVHDEIHPNSTPELSFPLSQQSPIGIVSSKSDIKRVSAVGFTQQSLDVAFVMGPRLIRKHILCVQSVYFTLAVHYREEADFLLLNMFRAPLCPSSGAREYYTSGCCLS